MHDTCAWPSLTRVRADSPFYYQVAAASPSASYTRHNVVLAQIFSRSLHTVPLELRVSAFDRFENVLTSADGYMVSVNGEGHELVAPDFAFTYLVKAGFAGDLVISFTLNGEEIADSPVTVEVTKTIGGASVALAIVLVIASLGLASIVFFYSYGRLQRAAVAKVERANQERSAMRQQRESVQQDNENLKASLRKKKHSEEELEVMMKAMEELEEKRKDKLEGVLIASSDIKIDRVLGKGGFGVVNLGLYKGQSVAVKQLLAINDESVKRFR